MTTSNDRTERPASTAVAPRTIGELARKAAASSYGVVRVAGPRWYHGLLARLGRGTSGVRVSTEPRLSIQLFLALAPGVPVAQVSSNVEKAVRYIIQRETGRIVDELAIHVGGVPVGRAGGGAQGSLGT
ncbi:MAG TPA: Asp23/Gls24 family envelope stress response protein [Candidatus Limnocylindria bacterium]|nr:Asp23/Gls24 family envelope stress response protein [Candidatus Limnocylindria bacterium]